MVLILAGLPYFFLGEHRFPFEPQTIKLYRKVLQSFLSDSILKNVFSLLIVNYVNSKLLLKPKEDLKYAAGAITV